MEMGEANIYNNIMHTGKNSFQGPPPPPSAPRAGKKDKNIFSPKNQLASTLGVTPKTGMGKQHLMTSTSQLGQDPSHNGEDKSHISFSKT